MDQQSLITVVNEIILSSSNQNQVIPSWVATAAYKIIDPKNIAPERVRLAAILQLRQISRQQCRGKFEPVEEQDTIQHHLFPNLQMRYPLSNQTNDGEPIYIRLEKLPAFDLDWNVERMRRRAGSLRKHANALEQWGLENLRTAAAA